MKTIFKFLFFLVATIFFVSCKTKKIVGDMPIQIKDVNFFCQQVVENEPQFTLLTLPKININIKLNQQSFNLYGTLRMQTDSIISISLQPLFGFEMYRIELYRENFRVLNKIKRNYFEADYDFFATISPIPVTFDLFQNLFTRKLFIIGRNMKNCNYNNLFTLEYNNETFQLTSTSGDGKIRQHINVSPEYEILTVSLTKFLEGSSVQAKYNTTTNFKKIKYPRSIAIEFNSKLGDAKLQFNFDKATFNVPTDLAPTNLYRYDRVTFNQLFNN